MAQLTLQLVHAAIVSWLAESKIAANGSFTPSYDNIAGLLDKIAKTYTLDGNFVDPLPELEGEDLEYAETLEEYFENLAMPYDYDSTGAGTLNRHDGTFMPNAYSYPQGKKTFAVTKPYDDLQKAFNSPEAFANIIAVLLKRLYDSYNVWKYNVKKGLLGSYADKCDDAMGVTTTFSHSTAYNVGTILYKSGYGVAIVVKAIKTTDYGSGKTLTDVVAGGHAVLLNLRSVLAKPVDEATGEAFIKSVKAVAEEAGFPSEGNSLNGNTLGVSQSGLRLYILKGIMPSIEVDTMAGAFHTDKITFPVDVKVIDDFGNADANIYALLVDTRGVKYHTAYRAVRSQENAEGDFMNYFLHVKPTLAFSRNTFVHVWKAS